MKDTDIMDMALELTKAEYVYIPNSVIRLQQRSIYLSHHGLIYGNVAVHQETLLVFYN